MVLISDKCLSANYQELYETHERCDLMKPGDIRVYGTVKVGERGQIVIPAKTRKEFDIKAGDFLLVVRTPMKDSFALIKTEAVQEMIRKMNIGLAGLPSRKKRIPASKTENQARSGVDFHE